MAKKPPPSIQTDTGEPADCGVILRAANGDVIRYDPSGLTLRLSDTVLRDITLRLDRGDVRNEAVPEPVDGDALKGVDAWDVRREGEWLLFTARLPGAQGGRGFRRLVSGGDILGCGPGPVLGVFGLGGPRAALANPGPPAFRYHVVAPADDIGAVGMAGIGRAAQTDTLEHMRECPHEALVADTLLQWQMDGYAPLPLFVARMESDASASAYELAHGVAVENLLIAAGTLKAAAARMGKPARIKAICLDYALEDLTGDATVYRDGMLAVMARIEAGLGALGFDKPLFVARFETGIEAPDPAILSGQWELCWNHGDHRMIYSASSATFAHDRFARPTEDARVQMAEMSAAAISEGETWRCPMLHLAEIEGAAGDIIRVTAQGDGALVLDGGGPAHGFALQGSDAAIDRVEIAPDDPQAVLLHCAGRVTGDAVRLNYLPRGAGGLHDGWLLESRTGVVLRRWALPAILPVHGGPRGA